METRRDQERLNEGELTDRAARSSARTQERFSSMTSSIHCFSHQPKNPIVMEVFLSASNRLLHGAGGTDHHVIHTVFPS